MQLKYNWNNNLHLKSIFLRIYQQSLAELVDEDKHYANEFINAIEDFVDYMARYKYNLGLNKTINVLENIKYIAFQEPNNTTNIPIIKINYVHPPNVIIQDRSILLRKNITGSKYLTSNERLRLFLYRGLCHLILNFQNEETHNFSQIYHEVTKDISNGEVIENLVDQGWLLLEDAIAEEIAESIVYIYANKCKPGLSFDGEENDYLIIDKTRFMSNYDSFRMFQPILVKFGWTLSNVGNLTNPNQYVIRHDIVKRAIDENFSESVIAEYLAKNCEFKLFQLLFYMGKLVNAKYTSFGINLEPNISISKEENNQAYDKITQLTMSLATLEETEYDKKLPIPTRPRNDVIKRKILILLEEKK